MNTIKVIRIFSFLAVLFVFSAFSSLASIVVLNGLTHENRAQPGETYRGTIQIQNTGKNNKSVRVYQRDYWFSYTGESKHDEAGTMERSNAGWISYNPELLTLDSSEVTTINFEVRVPGNDALRGTYWSVIMVEGITPPDTSQIESGVRINTAIRYAVQIVTNIGSSGSSDLEFLGLELARQDDQNMLYVAVENTGERILKPEMNLELFDESGNSVGVITSDQRKTFPGTSIMSSLVLEGIKPGNYNGVLVADCGEDRLYGTNLSLEIE
ncbi:MAG TPA: hypothetical protein VJ919_18770 [Tangfeifania sp.]|nr:hypothetical protein [Tangfeifania sp.]